MSESQTGSLLVEGDLIEAVKTEIASSTRFRGILTRVQNANGVFGLVLKAQGYEPMLQWLEDQGFEFTVIEKAAPKLPTEPGVYSDKDGSVWRLHFDEWYLIGANDVVHDGGGIVSRFAPLTPLEPASVTAKKVLDAIRQRIGSIDSAYDFQAVATQFGITE